jgi:molybdopterin molybdotransferase
VSQTSWHQARVMAYGSARSTAIEQLALTDAVARTCAKDLLSLTDLPAHRSSAMDGWAVNGEGPWRIVGEVRAGSIFDRTISHGEAVTIATGAAVPDGATSVVRSEDGRIDADQLKAHTEQGANIRAAGEEAREGDVIIKRGTTLTPLHIGLAAATGHDRIEVHLRPCVRIAVFGDELLREGRPQGGRIRDSLGPQLPTWMQTWGCDVVDVRFLPDTFDAHVDALKISPNEKIDLILTTGGTAHGPVDYLHAAIEERNGEVVVDSVDCRPGHPMLLTRWPTHHHIGLPGNPQAAIAALHTLAAPLVRAKLGMTLADLPTVTFQGSVKRHDRETRLIPCTLTAGVATPVERIGSGMLRGLTHADGFAVLTGANESVGWITLQQL